nr:PepSY domain-containing protein [uncultured Steroidobacter sp.]
MRWLILGHRWLGIATCLLFALWFVSGLVMMYVAFPALTAKERLSMQERIDWSRVIITPERVLQDLALASYPRELRLEMMAGEPVYRVQPVDARRVSVSAVDGRIIEGVDAAEARAIVAGVADRCDVLTVTTIERDQWSVAQTFNQHRPLHRLALNDERGTELYVSSSTGEIVLDTHSRERAWNWVGAVLHWLYFRDLRAMPAVWNQVVMWTSGVGIVVALSGLWLGIDRLRLRRRYRDRDITPYRGWMAWHHLAGLVGGVFVVTWIFSGWLSMGPPVPWNSEFDSQRMAAGNAAFLGNDGPVFPATVDLLSSLNARDAREASFVWGLGRPLLVLKSRDAESIVLDAATGAPHRFDEAALSAAAPRLLSDARLVSTQRLEHEDAYWYSRRAERPLPVLRFIFDDPDRTWIHVDPRTGQVLNWMRHSDRVDRWLFNALHSLDFRLLLAHRPAWDVIMWILSLAGLVISISSVVIGWRRLRA